MDRSPAIARSLLAWFRAHARDLPWRRTRDPYAIWVSEIMLQQTTVTAVVPYFIRWMRELPTVTALAAAPLEKVLKLWEGLGYYRRARLLHQAAQLVVSQHAGRLPEQPADWRELPGIGRYTAGAITSLAFNAPEPVLDGNVIRVLSRLEALDDDIQLASTRDRLWELATYLVRVAARAKSPRPCGDLNEALMELGATVCTPRQPACVSCPVHARCRAHATGQVEQLPHRSAPAAATRLRRTAWVFTHHDRFLVEQQTSPAHNAGLWQFPQSDSDHDDPNAAPCSPLPDQPVGPVEILGEIRHTITRYRITLQVVHASVSQPTAPPGTRWCTLSELRQLAMSRAHRRIVDRWLNASPSTRSSSHPARLSTRPARTANPKLKRRPSATRRKPS